MAEPSPFESLHLRILVGVDAKGLAAPAVERALSLVERYSDAAVPLAAKLRLVHAVKVPKHLFPGHAAEELEGIHGELFARARTTLSEVLRPVFEGAGVAGDAVGDVLSVVPGRPVDVLLHQSDDARANLILLGPHEKRAVFDFGSTARGILARTQIPAWNQIESPEAIERILVPTDFSECSDRALDYAVSLASAFGASIRLLHCMALPTFAGTSTANEPLYPTYVIDHEREHVKERLHELAASRSGGGVEIEPMFVEGEVPDAILRLVDTADLVCMGKRGYSRLSRLMLGNVAYSVLKRSPRPVVVLPEVRRAWFGDGPLEAVPAASA